MPSFTFHSLLSVSLCLHLFSQPFVTVHPHLLIFPPLDLLFPSIYGYTSHKSPLTLTVSTRLSSSLQPFIPLLPASLTFASSDPFLPSSFASTVAPSPPLPNGPFSIVLTFSSCHLHRNLPSVADLPSLASLQTFPLSPTPKVSLSNYNEPDIYSRHTLPPRRSFQTLFTED